MASGSLEFKMKTAAEILNWLTIAGEVLAVLPTPIQPEAALALQFLPIAQAAVKAHATSTGQTVEQVMAQLHKIDPIP